MKPDDRPSDGMRLDELQDEFDWMFEFQSRMAERIRGDADVHSLADYVGKLEVENAKLRELVEILCFCMQIHKQCDDCKLNGAKGELVHDPLCACDGLHEILRELGIEVDG